MKNLAVLAELKIWEVKLFQQWKENYKPREDPLDQVNITSLLWKEWAFILRERGTAWRNLCPQKRHSRMHSWTLWGISNSKASSSTPGEAGKFSFYQTLGKGLSQSPYLGLFPWCTWKMGWQRKKSSSPFGLLSRWLASFQRLHSKCAIPGSWCWSLWETGWGVGTGLQWCRLPSQMCG